MPTISQLPAADTLSASDLVPISQDGSAHAISVGALLAQTQPAIIVAPPSLLGRFSIGPGGPDTIMIGGGLTLNAGTLSASFDLGSLPAQTTLSATDQIVVSEAGTAQLLGPDQVRGLFTAGSNITIDADGTISASGSGADDLSSLSTVSALAATDLVAVSQAGQDHSISYVNFIDGVTIDAADPAGAVNDSDEFWTAQSSNVMLRQTLGNLWPWITGKLPTWKRLITELTANTTLDPVLHNNAIVVCSSPILISAGANSLGSGFTCEVLNASLGSVTFAGNIVTSNGLNGLSPCQCGTIHCVTYSGGTTIFASVSTGTLAGVAPGQPVNLTSSAITSSGITLSWTAPASGGFVSVYAIRYRITGTTTWLAAGQVNTTLSFTMGGLQATTSYDFSVIAANNIGTGPISAILTASTIANAVLPGAPIGVTVIIITSNSVTCWWTAPATGGPGLSYQVQFKAVGQSTWTTATNNLSAATYAITNLAPATTYDIQIIASNGSGSGPPSALVTAQTANVTGAVTSITWNLTPSGSIVHGTGSIGVNAHVNPATSPIQFGFSTSATTPPTSWTPGALVNSDLWGTYVATPATAGSWYAWAEGIDGSAPTVYPTAFTVT